MSASKAQAEAARLAARGAFTPYASPTLARHELTIPLFRPATLNDLVSNHGAHRWRAAKLKKRDRDTIILESIRQGTPKATGKRRISLIVARAGRMQMCDRDAFWKSTLDALEKAGLLVNDSPQWCDHGEVSQPKVQGDHYTTIILEDL